MNTTFKKSVATLLTAGMLLTGLTACLKTPEEKIGDKITELANQESDIKFDEIIHINVSNVYNRTKTLYITGYVKTENIDEKYQELEYKISDEDYEKLFALNNSHDIYYPFDKTTLELLSNIMTNQEPERCGTFDMNESFRIKLNNIVEKYCK